MRRIDFWKILVPAATVPLALWTFVALAGPGGFVGSDDDAPEPPAGADVSDGDVVDDGAGVDGGEADCFLTVLSDGAQSYAVLQEHVSDPDMPEGGVAGNQNAIDRICFRTLDTPKANTTAVPTDGDDAPGKSGDAPGKSGDAPGKSDAHVGSDTAPGKSEDAQGDPEPKGQANGGGQANADANGSGAADAPVHNKP